MPGPDMGGCAQTQTEAVSSAPSGTSFQVVLDSPSLNVCKTERSFREVTDYDRYHAVHFLICSLSYILHLHVNTCLLNTNTHTFNNTCCDCNTGSRPPRPGTAWPEKIISPQFSSSSRELGLYTDRRVPNAPGQGRLIPFILQSLTPC